MPDAELSETAQRVDHIPRIPLPWGDPDTFPPAWYLVSGPPTTCLLLGPHTPHAARSRVLFMFMLLYVVVKEEESCCCMLL